MDPTIQAILAASGSFLLITLLFGAMFLFCRGGSKRRSRNIATTRAFDLSSSASFDPSLKSISMGDLSAATNNFSNDLVIGDGGFGLVYKATLPSGVQVAVKRLDPDEFRAEMDTLAKLNHPNLVRILGYCSSGDDRVLIYEFKEKGSLDQWLHLQDSSSSSSFPLWNTRIDIIRGVANGLSYLHTLDTPIIHRDIKASNVLLDSQFNSYIANFGLAGRMGHSHSHVSTQVAGTMGYMPPEYKEGITAATVKADVYSFGILMFEVATSRRPNLSIRIAKREVGLVEWARKMVEDDADMEMVDPNISRQGLDEEAVREFFKIACLCTSDYSRERPVMSTVVAMLTHALFV